MIELVGQLIDVFNFINIYFPRTKKNIIQHKQVFRGISCRPLYQHHKIPFVYLFSSLKPNYCTLSLLVGRKDGLLYFSIFHNVILYVTTCPLPLSLIELNPIENVYVPG